MAEALPPLSEASRTTRIVRRLKKNDVVWHGALVFASSTLVNALGYVFHFVLSRRLGVASYGDLSALLSFLMITAVPSSILSTIVVKYVSEFRAVGDDGKLRTLVTRLLWSLSAFGLLLVIGVALAQSAIARFFHLHDSSAVAIESVLIGVSLILPVLRSVLQGIEDFTAFSFSIVLEAAVKLSAAIVLVWLSRGVAGAIGGWTLGSVASLTYTLYIVWQQSGRAVPERLRLDTGRLLSTSGAIGLYTLVSAVMLNFDTILVKHYLGAHEAGLYAGVSLTGKILLFFVSFVPITILPKVSARAARGEKSTRVLVQATLLAGTICLSALVLYYFAGGLLLKLTLGAAFASGAKYVFPYAVAMALLAAIMIVGAYKIGMHRFGFVLPLSIVALCEVGAVAMMHDSILQVINVLIVGHATALILCGYNLVVPLRAQPIGNTLRVSGE